MKFHAFTNNFIMAVPSWTEFLQYGTYSVYDVLDSEFERTLCDDGSPQPLWIGWGPLNRASGPAPLDPRKAFPGQFDLERLILNSHYRWGRLLAGGHLAALAKPAVGSGPDDLIR
jgi:hypothetical protein